MGVITPFYKCELSAMAVVGEFYGHVLERGVGSTLSNQLYQALRHEILRGRWTLGERIPSFKEIIAQTGLSRNSLLRALDQLEAGGYVERIRHKGVFVKATATHGNRSLGTVVIPVPADAPIESHHGQPSVETQTFSRISVGHLAKTAGKLGLRTRIWPVGHRSVWSSGDGGADSDLFGVISLFSPKQLQRFFKPRLLDRVVYLGTDDFLARPCLTGDPFTAAYQVASELIKHGHRCIALLPSPALHQATEDLVRAGIGTAMRDAGLSAGPEALPEMPGPDAPIPSDATAAFGFCGECARDVLQHARAAGFRVPEDLSVVSLQEQQGPPCDGLRICGAGYEWDDIIGTCFDILLSSASSPPRSVARLTFDPRVHEGNTVAPPRDSSVFLGVVNQ
jgi:hypothetical protein